MSKAIRTFENVRARLFRVEDGTWHTGWTVHLSQEEAILRLNEALELRLGETLVGEIYGDGTRVRLAGLLRSQAEAQISIGVQGSLLFQPSRDAVRFMARGVSGTLVGDTHEAQFVPSDLSPKGLGGLSDRPFGQGATLQMILPMRRGTFEGRVLVANCSVDSNAPGQFRLGLQIVEASRLDWALWQRALEACAEGADLDKAA